MNRSILIITGLIIVLAIVGVGLWKADIAHAPQNGQTPVQAVDGYKNATYVFDGSPITLADGKAETQIVPGSASKLITQYFGNEATGDLNNDGVPDIAFLVTQQAGGSGTFYYVVVALKTKNGYQGTNAVLLGDRIAPQSTRIEKGMLIVSYMIRKPSQPMSVQPSVGVSRYFTVDNNILNEMNPQ